MDLLKINALTVLYESVKNRISINLYDFLICMHDWNVVPLYEDNEIIGAVIIKGTEIHVGYAIKPTVSVLKHIKQSLALVLKDHGFATTQVLESNLSGLRFCKRLGFEITKQENSQIYMKCEKCNYV